ncbi:MAG TPA: hypothetical protein VM285_00515 [Polyangia bacterium]|nr:hypothetical protein [Polyangia bacterium]
MAGKRALKRLVQRLAELEARKRDLDSEIVIASKEAIKKLGVGQHEFVLDGITLVTITVWPNDTEYVEVKVSEPDAL